MTDINNEVMNLLDKLRGGDLRSIGRSNEVVADNEAPRSRAARYQRGLKTILYWKGTRRFPFQTNPFLVFYPVAELRGILLIKENPKLIEKVFPGLHDHDPVLKARVADVLEKATRNKPELLLIYKREIISILKNEKQQEVCWHIAQMIPRFKYTSEKEEVVFHALNNYLSHKSKIVRVSALEALADLAQRNKSIGKEVTNTIQFHTKTGSPAVQARGRKLLQRLKS